MKDLQRRLARLEAQQRHHAGESHHLPVLCYPWDLYDEADAIDAWLEEQLACDCGQCEGVKTVGILVPGKAPSAEAWSAQVQAWHQRRAAESEGMP